jgi:hypothetical protein
MKSLFQLRYRLSFLIILILLAVSCKKDTYVDDENELVYPVNFTFTNFKSSASFLKNASLKNNLRQQLRFLRITVRDTFTFGVSIMKL